MKLERPHEALRSTMRDGRMRTHKDGPWIRCTDFEAWRNYALALESKLRGLEKAHCLTLEISE